MVRIVLPPNHPQTGTLIHTNGVSDINYIMIMSLINRITHRFTSHYRPMKLQKYSLHTHGIPLGYVVNELPIWWWYNLQRLILCFTSLTSSKFSSTPRHHYSFYHAYMWSKTGPQILETNCGVWHVFTLINWDARHSASTFQVQHVNAPQFTIIFWPAATLDCSEHNWWRVWNLSDAKQVVLL